MRTEFKALLVAGTLALGAAPASADELSGAVITFGWSLNTTVRLNQPNEKNGPKLCMNDLAKRIRKLSAMTVKVTGEWTKDDKGENKCFEATDFTVQKTSSGRDAIVGTLSEKSGSYQVTGDDGKVMTLGEVTGGLKKLAGQKVILDLKAMDNPAAKEATYKVVTYAAFP